MTLGFLTKAVHTEDRKYLWFQYNDFAYENLPRVFILPVICPYRHLPYSMPPTSVDISFFPVISESLWLKTNDVDYCRPFLKSFKLAIIVGDFSHVDANINGARQWSRKVYNPAGKRCRYRNTLDNSSRRPRRCLRKTARIICPFCLIEASMLFIARFNVIYSLFC